MKWRRVYSGATCNAWWLTHPSGALLAVMTCFTANAAPGARWRCDVRWIDGGVARDAAPTEAAHARDFRERRAMLELLMEQRYGGDPSPPSLDRYALARPSSLPAGVDALWMLAEKAARFFVLPQDATVELVEMWSERSAP